MSVTTKKPQRIAHRKRGRGPSPTFSIRVSPETKTALYRIANRRKMSITALVAPVIAQYASDNDPAPKHGATAL